MKQNEAPIFNFPQSSLPSLQQLETHCKQRALPQCKQGCALPGHCTSPEVLPIHIPPIKRFKLPPVVVCGAAEEQCTNSFYLTKQGKKKKEKKKRYF